MQRRDSYPQTHSSISSPLLEPATEPDSLERNVASPPRASTPPANPATESIVDLEPEDTSVPVVDLIRSAPPKDLEKGKTVAKTPAVTSQQPGPGTTPQVLEKKKVTLKPRTTQQQQQQQQQQQPAKH